MGQPPNISHLGVFGCVVYVPITPPKRTKLAPQIQLVYVDFDSPSIIRYIEPLTGDLFKACFVDYHFDESVFLPLGGGLKSIPEECLGKYVPEEQIKWNTSRLKHLDPRMKESELEVQKIIYLQGITNQLSDEFIDTKNVIKSHIPATNTLANIDIPHGQGGTIVSNKTNSHQKCGRPMVTKYKASQKRKTQNENTDAPKELESQNKINPLDKTNVGNERVLEKTPENDEILINYISSGRLWN